MKTFGFLLLFLVLFFANRGYSQENNTTLEDAINEAKQNNLQIKAAKQRYMGSLKNVTFMKTWDYPMVEVESDNVQNLFTASQGIPFPGKLSLKGKIAKKQAGMAGAELDSKIREIIAEVKKAYWAYWQAGKNIELYQENLDLLKRMSNISRSLYEVGKVPLSDVFKANIEIGKTEAQLVISQQENISAQASLAALLNRSTDTSLGNPVKPEKYELKYSLDELKDHAFKNSPELKSKSFSYQSSKDALTLSKFGWLPDFSVGIKINGDYRDYMAQATLPIYFWKQKADVNRAAYEKEAAGLELQSENINLTKDLTDLYAQYQAHEKFINIYETNVIPLTKQTLSLSEEGYRTGKNSFLDLLDSQKRYLDYSIEYYMHVVVREDVLAELEMLVGTDLDER